MQKHSKNRNVPFPRPCGATGNGAQKLHAPAFAHFRGAVLTHEVLFYAEGSFMEKPEPIRPEGRNTAARKGAAIHRASVGNRAEQHRLPQPEQRTERDIF